MLRSVFRPALTGLIAATPTPVYRRCMPRDVLGLCYHMVSDDPQPHTAHITSSKTPAQFEADLQYVTRHYEVISYDQLVERRAGREKRAESEEQQTEVNGANPSRFRPSTSRPAVILTFDDGLREHLTVVAPLLKKHGIPGVFFITTDWIDNANLFYRHKVSLCIDRVRSFDKPHLEKVVRRIERDASCGGDKAPVATKSGLADWLKSLTMYDQHVIDRVCELLEVNWRHFLRERKPYLTAEEIRSLADDGFTIGGHTKTHVRLSLIQEGRVERGEGRVERGEGRVESGGLRVESEEQASVPLTPDTSHLTPGSLPPDTSHLKPDLLTPDLLSSLAAEIADSCQIVAELIGKPSVPFAFPFSGDGLDRSQLRAIRERNPQVDLMFDRHGFRSDEDFIVHRVIADRPRGRSTSRSNVAELIRREYTNQARHNIVATLTGGVS